MDPRPSLSHRRGVPIRRRGQTQDTGCGCAIPVAPRLRVGAGLGWAPCSTGSGGVPAGSRARSGCVRATRRATSTRVDFEELAPGVDTFLGQAAYLQLGFFETLSELIASTPELAKKEALSRAAGAALTKHEELVALIRERGDDPTDLMLPFREPLDAFRAATHGVRPQETMLSVHITAGMLDDFYLALSASYGDTGRRVARILRADDDRQAIVDHASPRRSRATRSGSRCSRCGAGASSATPC